MNNENNKIIGYDAQTGQPIYEKKVNNINKEKISKGFIISYIISFVLFFILIFIFVSMPELENRYIITNLLSGYVDLLWNIIFFGVSFSSMILSIILGIKNKKRITNNVLRNIIVVMLWVISIAHILVILYLIVDVYINPLSLLKSEKIPEYDFNEVWLCNKYGSNDTRTYKFKKNGSIEAKLDSDPENYYLIGSYIIEDENIEDSLYTGDRDGKIKTYDLKINFNEYVENGVSRLYDSVNWYIDVYNGNYMTLRVANGTLYHCTIK